MFDWDFPLGASSVRVLVRLAEERGIRPEQALAGTALTPRSVTDPNVDVSARQELRVVRNLLARCGDEPGLGVEAGARHHISLYGPWGLALLSSRTLREVIDVAQRYLELAFVFGRLTLEEDADEVRLVFDGPDIPEDLRPFLTERVLAGLPAIGRELYSVALPLHRVTFRHAAPADTARYREMFGVEPVFGASANIVAVDRRDLDQPLPQAGDWARQTCEQLCRDLLAQRRARGGVAGSVRDLLVRRPGEIPDQAAVAAGLYMSPRTLSRRLNEEGTSFRALLDEVRQMLSEELLTHTHMTTEQVAGRLGYAEAASFIRAFRRWKGCPPQEFRARNGFARRQPALV
ncbi:AraC family transcriptional regulator [Nocardia arthritidis]|uniref:Helix-turn-helix domain-containing protein n=1 Tax=Nocardia arthritidis TaxID=228602 RepID=A0A6G9YIM1_9NOCA|nr:AraC family transcriptional regulator [Nocardia arthritidis]QIS13034.1 helix-turn-helix domain-containing protein [Nocardia arthritidis]